MSTDTKINKTIKPFLRWAGGKTWLVNRLSEKLNKINFNNYHEPFLGGGAIYFSLDILGKSFLYDFNKELINTYKQVRDNPELVLSHLKKHINSKEHYYWVRDEFNPISKHGKASKFIYLNQTSFNGIYRVNLKGKYNVPFGFRKKNFYDPMSILAASEKLQSSYLSSCDFSETVNNVANGDLVFLDPPYTISHNHNGFFKYNEKLFSKDDQCRLSQYIDAIKDRNAYYILTNAAHSDIKSIFDKDDFIIKLNRASLIGGKNAPRKKYSEFIFTNIPSLYEYFCAKS
jgi:DNA adenine methylase